ncbi:PAS domain-containing protein [Ureibacillus sinduriensis]|uniref:PAS domain-containing protein n=1 Tax=Ureibacillus sinduriensis TaxID=561440 RepID=UPI000A00F729
MPYHESIFAGKNFNSHYEYRLLNKNGQYIWLEANINTVYNEKGQFVRLVLVARDIIERKKYQNQ